MYKLNSKTEGSELSDMIKDKRITVRLPETLVAYMDECCDELSTEVIEWDRSKFIRQLIVEKRDGTRKDKKEENLKWNFPREADVNKDSNEEYGDLLDLSGYKR